MDLISIVIPVFNAEKYLNECIESIIKQSFNNLEIVLVNDGSTDSSRALCDEWAQIDTRIRVIHKKNEGVTIARKTGVENSSGKWICFVDSDDSLPENAISILASYIRDDIDMVYGSTRYIGNKQLLYSNFGEKNTIQYLKLLLKHQVYWVPFARLIRKSLFDDFTFDMPSSIIIGEDFIMNLRLAQKVRRIILLPDIVYNYIWYPNSAMSKLSTLDKNYRSVYTKTFFQSISPEYEKALKGAIVSFRIKRIWRLLKMKIKIIIWTK